MSGPLVEMYIHVVSCSFRKGSSLLGGSFDIKCCLELAGFSNYSWRNLIPTHWLTHASLSQPYLFFSAV